jgi:DNA-binding SARP family transcriptional activator/tetratricopeptide (TPR) repeat protein
MEPSSSRPVIRFRAFGTPDLICPDGTEIQSILARPKLLGLLAFLACAEPRGFHRRDVLLGLFWAEVDQQRGRRALRQSLYYLRQSLGDGVVLGRGDEEVAIDDERLWSDVGAFELALGEERAEEALELYRGELLAGFYVTGAPEFERWLADRREALRRQACAAAWQLAERMGSEGNAAAAGHWAHRTMVLAPLDEGLAAQAIALLDRLGDRAGAVRVYEAFARRLEEDLDLEPSPETRELVEEIRSRTEVEEERFPTGPTSSDAADGSAVAPAPGAPAGPPGEPGAAEPPGTVPSREPVSNEREPAASGLTATPPAGSPPPASGRSLRTRGFRLGLVAGIIVTIALVVMWAFRPREGTPANPRRVVVSVFENQTGEADLDPLGRMAADWITQGLVESGLVDVVPSTFALGSRPDFTDPEPPATGGATSLAEASGAGTVVAGAYYRRGESVEFQVQIIDARNGRLLSAVAPVSGALDDPGAAIDSLRRSVVRTLAVLIEPTLAGSDAASHPPSLEAYREYLEGKHAFERLNDMRSALTHFYAALALDSTFFPPRFYIIFAHVNLGEVAAADSNAQLLVLQRTRMTDYQRATLDWLLAGLSGNRIAALEAARVRGGLDLGVEALSANHPREAIDALADNTALSDFYFQWLTLVEAFHMVGDYRLELREARRVREVYPDRLRPLSAEVRALAAQGRIDDVDRWLDESLLLPREDGVSPPDVMAEAAAELRAHGFRQTSLEVADRALDWLLSRPADEATGRPSSYRLALAYYQAERWEEAQELFEELASEIPNDVNLLGYLGVLAARRGVRDEALRISDALTGLAPPMDFGRDLYWQACIAAQLDERERAMILLREAYARGRRFSVTLHRDMDLEPLHDYPPFQQLISPKG